MTLVSLIVVFFPWFHVMTSWDHKVCQVIKARQFKVTFTSLSIRVYHTPG